MALIKRIFKGLTYLLVGLVLSVTIYLNIRLYYTPNYVEVDNVEINEGVLHQLRYLKTYLHKDGGKSAQGKYPEGFVFINALYGLTWCDFIAKLPKKSSLRKEGFEEIDWTLQQLNSDYAKMLFPNKLSPENGIFYVGWKNYLLGKKISIQDSSEWEQNDTFQYSKQCDLICSAFKTSKQTYLESYVEAVWPADNIVAVASLSLYNNWNREKPYLGFINNWIEKVKLKLDHKTGLIPHEVVFGTEKTKEGAKGSSQSLMLNFLMEIDPDFAKEQFVLYKKLFLDYRLGLPGIREYPKGIETIKEVEDVDSGPIIWSIGGAASLVGQRTMARYGATTEAIGLRNSIESFGAAYTSDKQKIYVLGLEPIADAFIAWANVINIQKAEKQTANWRWAFQLLSLTLVIIIWVLFGKAVGPQRLYKKYHKNKKVNK